MKPKPTPIASGLRRRAEVRLRDQRKAQRPRPGGPVVQAGALRMVHELEVHQIELELQNAELRKVRDDMEAALQRYTDLYDFAPVGYFSLDQSGLIQEVNLTGAAMLGVERSRLIRLRLARFFAPASQAVYQCFLQKVFAQPPEKAREAVRLQRDGVECWVELQATNAFDPGARTPWCRVSVSDISVRRQAEEVLRRNEALFSALIEQAPVGVYVVDSELRLQQINPRARPAFSKIEPLLGRDFAEILHCIWPQPTATKILARFRHTLLTGQPYFAPDLSERRRDLGVTESYEWQLQRLTLPAGLHGVVCFFNNITERKRAEAARHRLAVLTASKAKLEQEIVRRRAVEASLRTSEQHQMQLSAQARQLSHQILHAQEEERKRISRELHDEIAQSLVGINVHLAALTRETAVPPTLRQQIVRTQRLVGKSVDVVHRFARELRPPVLDDLGLIPALHHILKEFMNRTGVRAQLASFATIEQLPIAKRTVLYRVAHEALNNVARHAEASHVEVRLEQLPDRVRMEVVDDGKSFDVEDVLQANRGRRLGLLGMRERLEMVGGSFAIISVRGRGTTVAVEIPDEPESAATPRRPRQAKRKN